ncbi:hypothetical protein CHLRE_08g382515v5 [Chlamydomonas reinhardtii]|uniref:CTLH domain-containing protein n=1 Tax=Chlamydomonas reinhardtii TaxID=3055 RepID=A0A2K3DI48_CHLRE|nr:uncharacterized protein CHLRE_08g382515v5 [Chlamydomonas reinhardtii]PNW80208.1 hypothetical protein CHLRE_08g382515v5 [Chlamydomonas reinhardtii]
MSAPSDGTSMDAQLSVQDRLGPRKLINRTEYVRLLEQALHRLGYPDVANLLEQQAGVQMQPPAASRFQAAVLGGRWEEAAALLPGLTPAAEVVREARFLILQQKYLEALEAQDLTTALTVLRCEMAALAAGGGGGGGGSENGAAGGGAANGVAAAGEPGAAAAAAGGGEGPAAAGAAAAVNGVAAGAAGAGPQQQQQQAALGAVGQAVVHEQQLHHLAALLLCPASGDAAARAAWLGGGRAHRPHLLSLLQARLPPHLMIPEGRLEVLVEQALEAQIQRCPYHNAPEGRLSLLADFRAGVECLPTTTVQVLEQHSDEVWHIAFSHDGSMLATASKDRTAVLWAVRPSPLPTTTTPGTTTTTPSSALTSAASAPASSSPQTATGLPNQPNNQPNQLNNQQQQQQYLTPLHVLGGHSQPVAFLSWSPDDRRIITCSEEMLRVWDVATGQMLHCFSHHRESVTCCAWLPDCRRLVSGGADRAVCLVDGVAGRELQRWKRPYRVQDLAVTRDGAVLVMASSDRRVHLMRLADTREAALPPEPAPITSLALSPDGRLLLVALQTCTVRLWALGGAAGPHSPALDLGPDPLEQLPAAPAAEYSFNEGRPSRFVLRCGFGGSGGAFVVHGSDEGLVYVWHRDGGGGGEPLLRLAGHSATVNAVAWNPANPYMLASASDDKTVRVWLAAAAQQGGGGPAAAAARKALPLLQFAPTANGGGGGGGGAVGMDVAVGGGAAAMAAEG